MLKRLMTLAIAGALSVGLMSGAMAAQGSGCMPTTGTVSGLTFAQDVNAGFAALISSNSGASAPITDCTAATIKGQMWLDTSVTPNVVRQYDGTAWVTIGSLDSSNHLFAPPIGGGISVVTAASTIDLGALPNAVVNINGNTTISSFGSSAVVGSLHTVVFFGSPTITYNASTMLLLGSQDIAASAGDTAVMEYMGAGAWRMLTYTQLLIPIKSTPTTSDYLLIQDAAANNASKKSTIASVAATSQVTGIDGKTGAFTTGNGLDSTGGNVIELTAARRTLPTHQVLSGSGTYNPPSGVLYIRARMAGGGAGGGGSGSGAGGGGAGAATSFGAFVANGGSGGGTGGSGSNPGGAGGSASGCLLNYSGGAGDGTSLNSASGVDLGGRGGSNPFFGGGAPPGLSGQVSTGGAGSGGSFVSGSIGGGGGGAGGACEGWINSPGSQSYSVGTGGSGGTVGSGGNPGQPGGSGTIIVDEFYN